jgi:5,10-methylenetetrahydrofolate reductase
MTANSRLFSLEFFPPRTPEGNERLRATRRQLKQLKPAFCSVTFGAGGSTREGTLATVLEFRDEGMQSAPHISCMGGSKQSIREVLARYKAHDIRHIVALRGDLPSGEGATGDFRFASELVAFIRKESGDWSETGVGTAGVAMDSPNRADKPRPKPLCFSDIYLISLLLKPAASRLESVATSRASSALSPT